MERNIIITPLSKFPTEVLLHQYRKNRICRNRIVRDKYLYTERKWLPHYSIIDSERVEDYWELWENKKYSYKAVVEVHCKQDEHYDWKGDCYWYGDHIFINFDGMKWEGELQELHDELDSREHVNINNKKAYRKWLINYRKNKKR